MRKRRRGEQGFTLMEIIVVLAVIAALAAILVPVVFRYIDDAKKAQSAADAQMIAAAINQVYKDTGHWPFCKDCSRQGKLSHQSADDLTYLTSNDACTGGTLTLNASSGCDSTSPKKAGSGDGSDWADAKGDALANHLIKNNPFNGSGTAYSTSVPRPWKGAYLDKLPQVDAWGRSYLVNIINADPAGEGSTQNWVIVLSAGPNGTIETIRDAAGTSNPSAGGDDIIARVK